MTAGNCAVAVGPQSPNQQVVAPCLAGFCGSILIPFQCSFLGLFGDFQSILGGFLTQVQLQKNPTLGGNEVDRLGLFWIDFDSYLWISSSFNQIKHKFFFSTSPFISYLFLFPSFKLVNLVYVQLKCLAFIVSLHFVIALIHARLDLLPHFMLIALYASLSLIWGFYVWLF